MFLCKGVIAFKKHYLLTDLCVKLKTMFCIVNEANGSGELFFPFFWGGGGLGAFPFSSLEPRSVKKVFFQYVSLKNSK